MISLASCTTQLNDLPHIKIPESKTAGAYWKPLKHSDLITSLILNAKKSGFTLTDNRVLIWYGNLRMDASLKFTILDKTSKIPLWLGVSASNDRSRVLKFYSGIEMEDSYLITNCFTGGKYTTAFDVDLEAQRAIDILSGDLANAVEDHDTMISTRIPSPDYDSTMMEVGRRGILPWSKIGKADHGTNRVKIKSFWDFHRSVTKVIGLTSGPKQLDNLYALRELVVSKITHICSKSKI